MNDPTILFLLGSGIVIALGLGINAFIGYKLRKLGED